MIYHFQIAIIIKCRKLCIKTSLKTVRFHSKRAIFSIHLNPHQMERFDLKDRNIQICVNFTAMTVNANMEKVANILI